MRMKKVLAFVMAMIMMLSVCTTAASAANWSHADHDHGEVDEINYVSLGDSMANGYGLEGYNGNTGVEDYGKGSYANLFENYLSKFADVNHAQLAMSAMRIEDLHWLLEVDYEDEKVLDVIAELEAKGWNEDLWYSVFTNGDYWTWEELVNNYRFDVAAYCIEGKDETAFNNNYRIAYDEYDDVEALQVVAEYYQTSVAEGDIISLGMGNGNFGVFAFRDPSRGWHSLHCRS